MYYMDTTIRNLDETAYRRLKARAALEGRTMGAVLSDAIRAYLERNDPRGRVGSLADLVPEEYPSGSELLSEETDAVVFGL